MARHAIVATLSLLILLGGVSSEFHSVIKWGIAIFAFGIFGAWLHGSGDINDRIAVEQAVMKMFKMETIRVFNNRFKTREEVEEKYGPNVIYWIYEKDHDSCKLRIWNVSRKWFSEHAAFSAFIMIVSPSALTTAMYEIPEISLITFFGTYLAQIIRRVKIFAFWCRPRADSRYAGFDFGENFRKSLFSPFRRAEKLRKFGFNPSFAHRRPGRWIHTAPPLVSRLESSAERVGRWRVRRIDEVLVPQPGKRFQKQFLFGT